MDTNPAHDEAVAPAVTGRERLRAFAGGLLDIMESLDKPQTYLEVERAARAVMVMDRMMTQLDQAPRPVPSRASCWRFADDLPRERRSDGRSDGGSGGRSQMFDDDCDEDQDEAYAEAHKEDYIDIIMTKLDKLAKSKGYPPYGDNSYEAETGSYEAEGDDETGDDETGGDIEAETSAAPEPCTPADPPVSPRPLNPSSPPFSRERPLGPYLTSINYPEPPRTSSGISTPPGRALSEGYYRLTPWRDPP